MAAAAWNVFNSIKIPLVPSSDPFSGTKFGCLVETTFCKAGHRNVMIEPRQPEGDVCGLPTTVSWLVFMAQPNYFLRVILLSLKLLRFALFIHPVIRGSFKNTYFIIVLIMRAGKLEWMYTKFLFPKYVLKCIYKFSFTLSLMSHWSFSSSSPRHKTLALVKPSPPSLISRLNHRIHLACLSLKLTGEIYCSSNGQQKAPLY